MQKRTAWQKLKHFVRGNKRTLLSASEANAVVDAINCFLGIRAGRGIKIQRAEAGITITWDPESPGETTDTSAPGAGGAGAGNALNFRGQWNDTDTYNEGDLVYRFSATELAAGQGGTFLAKTTNTNSEPPFAGTGDEENTDWKLFAPWQAWHDFWIDPAGANGQTEVLGGKVTVTVNNTATPTIVLIDKADLPAGVDGKTIKIRELLVCEAGVSKKMLVLASESYT